MLSPADCQPELALRLREADTRVTPGEVNELCGLLRGRRWVTAKALQLLRPQWTERHIRALASASAGKVISAPGSHGYCLEEEATDAEIARACSALNSQLEKMHARHESLLEVMSRRQIHAQLPA
jgi:hypothetical protein